MRILRICTELRLAVPPSCSGLSRGHYRPAERAPDDVRVPTLRPDLSGARADARVKRTSHLGPIIGVSAQGSSTSRIARNGWPTILRLLGRPSADRTCFLGRGLGRARNGGPRRLTELVLGRLRRVVGTGEHSGLQLLA